jgi:hypothetical protein
MWTSLIYGIKKYKILLSIRVILPIILLQKKKAQKKTPGKGDISLLNRSFIYGNKKIQLKAQYLDAQDPSSMEMRLF